MTDKPTPEQIQRANALSRKVLRAGHWEVPLADTIAQLDAKDAMVDGQAALIATLTAERDKARADLGEISRLLDQPMVNSARAIAAPYRVETDPLEAEADKLMAMDQSTRVIVLSALKRGLEIGRQA